jgi:hypothetical protein
MLKQAISADDRQKIATVIRYPLHLYDNGKVVRTYQDETSILADFDSLFSPSVRSAILSARYEDLFINSQGVMVGNGAVWFDGWGTDNKQGGPLMIKAINPQTG